MIDYSIIINVIIDKYTINPTFNASNMPPRKDITLVYYTSPCLNYLLALANRPFPATEVRNLIRETIDRVGTRPTPKTIDVIAEATINPTTEATTESDGSSPFWEIWEIMIALPGSMRPMRLTRWIQQGLFVLELQHNERHSDKNK